MSTSVKVFDNPDAARLAVQAGETGVRYVPPAAVKADPRVLDVLAKSSRPVGPQIVAEVGTIDRNIAAVVSGTLNSGRWGEALPGLLAKLDRRGVLLERLQALNAQTGATSAAELPAGPDLSVLATMLRTQALRPTETGLLSVQGLGMLSRELHAQLDGLDQKIAGFRATADTHDLLDMDGQNRSVAKLNAVFAERDETQRKVDLVDPALENARTTQAAAVQAVFQAAGGSARVSQALTEATGIGAGLPTQDTRELKKLQEAVDVFDSHLAQPGLDVVTAPAGGLVASLKEQRAAAVAKAEAIKSALRSRLAADSDALVTAAAAGDENARVHIDNIASSRPEAFGFAPDFISQLRSAAWQRSLAATIGTIVNVKGSS